jgi:hypothetical protein
MINLEKRILILPEKKGDPTPGKGWEVISYI